ncbi:16S rRNA (guanine(527)-N(7))-methyltransferase RsmG [Candidatus Izimaplasma bacterium HR1]|uniref:16S rRNA (guanine(527)-N(7))-methyltransferase RsmG n=1 Tax=Candidatus Izimoplasma sp. HR1 TaxID=1541959 RepID=UPI00056E2B26
MVKDYLNIFGDNQIVLSETQLEQFNRYFELLVEWNEKINLTAITEKGMVYHKHFLDSLSLRNLIPSEGVTLLDVGSGAGFPSIPMKILYPNIKVTIIDALQKRINFLKILSDEINVEVELIHGRAEELKRNNSYNYVTARAVANLRVLSELCIPFVKVGGYFVSLKGPKYEQEIKECSKTFEVLGAEFEDTLKYQILNEEKTLLLIKKIKETSDKYPRKFNKIKNKPL